MACAGLDWMGRQALCSPVEPSDQADACAGEQNPSDAVRAFVPGLVGWHVGRLSDVHLDEI